MVHDTMRRRPEFKCAEQMPEKGLSIFCADAQRIEHFSLQLWLVNPHAAAPDFHAV